MLVREGVDCHAVPFVGMAVVLQVDIGIAEIERRTLGTFLFPGLTQAGYITDDIPTGLVVLERALGMDGRGMNVSG